MICGGEESMIKKVINLKNFISEYMDVILLSSMIIIITLIVFGWCVYQSNNNYQQSDIKTIRLTVVGKTSEVSHKIVGRIVKTVTKPVVIVEYKGDLIKVFITENQANMVDIGKSYLFIEYNNGRLSLYE